MIKKQKLRENVDKAKSETGAALQTIYDAMNNGQKKQIVKHPEVKALLVRYGVIEE